MSEPPRLRLHRLVQEFRAKTLDTKTFCEQFERTYNLELDKTSLSGREATAFGQLFEEVVWYSPFHEDRAEYPGYRTEFDIARAAENAAQQLAE